MRSEALAIEPRTPELHAAARAVGDDVYGVELGVLRQRLGDLGHAVALGVEQHNVELAVAGARLAQVAHQLLVALHSGIDEDQLAPDVGLLLTGGDLLLHEREQAGGLQLLDRGRDPVRVDQD